MKFIFSNDKNKLRPFSGKSANTGYEQESEIRSDVLGSYTGGPDDDDYDVPVQDADDL